MVDETVTALERALVDHLLELSWVLDDMPEDQIELETAVKLLEDIAALVGRLESADRARFASIARQLAVDAEPARAKKIRDAMDSMGLSDG
jgi:hypothetical protein